MLRLDKDVLNDLLLTGSEAQIPLSLSIKYHHVYYALIKVMNERARLDKDFVKSINLWNVKITTDNPSGYFKSRNLDEYINSAFFVSFLSDWQLSLLMKDSDMVCLDSTHKTCIDGNGKDCYLYTLVARYQVTGKGEPLCP